MTHICTYNDIKWLSEGSTLDVFLDSSSLPENLCSTAFVVCLTSDGKFLLSTVLKRGIDIPGGHIEPGETAYDAAIREVKEETGATIEILGKIGHYKITVPDLPDDQLSRYPKPISYNVFYYGIVIGTGEVSVPEECGEPQYLSLDEVSETERLAKCLPYFREAHRLFGFR